MAVLIFHPKTAIENDKKDAKSLPSPSRAGISSVDENKTSHRQGETMIHCKEINYMDGQDEQD